MKIAIVINDLMVRGGTHKQVLRLCEYLEKMKADFVLCTRSYDLQKTYNGFEKYNPRYLYREEHYWKGSQNVLQSIRHILWKEREDEKLFELIPKDVDIVNIHDNALDGIVRRAKKAGKKVVWQINDIDPIFGVGVSKVNGGTIKNKILRFLYIQNIKEVDRITVNVTKNAERVKECFKIQAQVFYCGVDVNTSLVKHYHRNITSEFKLLSMGVFFSYRNYETLIEVIKRLNGEGYRAKLDIIGKTDYDMDYTTSIRNKIKQNNLENQITIWGQVDDEQYSRLFNSADAFAFVNIEQSWGLAVFEAMSAGLPTIVSNSVGAVELLHSDDDSIVVDPMDVDGICDVIKKLILDSLYYNKIAENAAKAVKEYTWEKLYCEKMFSLYKELILQERTD